MLRHKKITLDRLEHFTSDGYWKKNNLRGDFYLDSTPIEISVAGPLDRISFKAASKLEFKETSIGESFGPTWKTFWFRIVGKVPSSWIGSEVHLRWDSNCEGLIFSPEGHPLQGLVGGTGCDRRAEYIISKSLDTENVEFYIEVACNGMFGAGEDGLINPPDENKTFQLKLADVAVFDRERYNLFWDFRTIADMAKNLPEESSRGARAMFVANSMINAIDVHDRSTWTVAHEIAKKFLSDTNGSSQAVVNAVGHCHIDTAWLWPYAETRRKCARSWATQVCYMNHYPEYKFACSQAQQYEWVKEDYPSLFRDIKEKVQSGAFVPTGGTWVEMDGNLPSGESMVRQFLYGQAFFQEHFGKRCNEFWLPDTFGYSAQLPQLIRGAGMEYFLTQKLSWNNINKFPYHSFFWEGIDGSRVLTHFPPADTYVSAADVTDLLKSISNFKDNDRHSEVMMLFGHGDGGGGPQMDHIERLRRLKDVDGLPKVKIEEPTIFFANMKRLAAEKLNVWVGELYFELHRGTYTSQANNKKGNRFSERLLRDVEIASSLAGQMNLDFEYPSKELHRLWKLLLLNQFHDVLPGSSIQLVYKDSDEHYADILSSANSLLTKAMECLRPATGNLWLFNSLHFSRTMELEVPTSCLADKIGTTIIQKTGHETFLVLVKIDPFSVVSIQEALLQDIQSVGGPVSLKQTNLGYILESQQLRASILKDGSIDSLIHKSTGREVVTPGQRCNKFIIFDDVPFFWDAWDVEVYHLEKKKYVDGADSSDVVEEGPVRVAIKFKYTISDKSSLVQIISLTAGSQTLDFTTDVEWHESHKFLKVEFPVDIRSPVATYDIQFGHIQRPTTFNTSWDIARFEVCGHYWADLSEFDFGVALLNDCKYGYSAHFGVMRLSLLRSPKAPDDMCDMGAHRFRYALMPHQGPPCSAVSHQGSVVEHGLCFNSPLRLLLPRSVDSTHTPHPLPKVVLEPLGSSASGVVLDTIKRVHNEETSGDLVVRVYESYGGRGSFSLSFAASRSVCKAWLCNLLEDKLSELPLNGNSVSLSIHPFQIVTVRFSFV